LCPTGTSGEIHWTKEVVIELWWVKFDVFHTRHVEQFNDALFLAGKLLILIEAEQYVCRLTAVGDDDRAFGGGFFGAAGVLIEFATG
jgi:hypothetical protein